MSIDWQNKAMEMTTLRYLQKHLQASFRIGGKDPRRVCVNDCRIQPPWGACSHVLDCGPHPWQPLQIRSRPRRGHLQPLWMAAEYLQELQRLCMMTALLQ